MDKKLTFAFANVLAFVTWLYIGYVVYMGAIYSTLGEQNNSYILSAICMIALAITIFVAQQLKGAKKKLGKKIKWERVLVALSIVAILFTWFPYNRFWCVRHNQGEISKQFASAIKSSKEMFDEYERYVDVRKENLEVQLKEQNMPEAKMQNRLDFLELQLKSDNYKLFRDDAIKWIDNSSDSPTIWNVFVFGNLQMIEETIIDWKNKLYEMSSVVTTAESTPELFIAQESYEIGFKSNMTNIRNLFTTNTKFSFLGLLTYIGALLLLWLPYIIQRRAAKSGEHLFPWLHKKEDSGQYEGI